MGKILVLYDSRSGNTEKMARLVADLVYGRHSLDEVLEAARSSTPVA